MPARPRLPASRRLDRGPTVAVAAQRHVASAAFLTPATHPRLAGSLEKGRRMTATTTPDTIVLIHGFWVTPRSWEDWISRYESRGYRVLAPAYPGFEVEVEALNEDPSPIEAVTVPQILERLESLVGELD
jgi:pimeloyl-ACP methyl ester carboxylesterase